MATQEDSSVGVHRHHGYRGRVRSGCLTCRSRKIKCDERRPICENCTKSEKRKCVYKPRQRQPPLSAPLPSPRSAGIDGAAHANEGRLPLTGSTSPKHPSPILEDQSYSLAEKVRHHIATRTYSEAVQDGFLSLDRLRSSSFLQCENEVNITIDEDDFDPALPSTLISRDIKLTTTMDFLTAGEVPFQLSLSFFVDTVDCPWITPFDSINWRQMKLDLVHLAMTNTAVASSIIALSVIYKAQLYSLPLSKTLSLHQSSRSAYKKLLHDGNKDFSTVLAATLLHFLFQLVYYEAIPILEELSETFLIRLKLWVQDPSSHSELSSRIIVWLRIIHATTIRGGGMGLIPDSVCRLFPGYNAGIPNLKLTFGHRSATSTQLLQTLSAPVFEFYFQLQMISGDIARLTHYHRSRTTGADQEEVGQQTPLVASRLHALWESRSATQCQTPEDLRSHLAPQIAGPLISLIGVCTAAYYAEFIELDRLLGDPVSTSADSKRAWGQIREVVDSDWNAYDDGGKLNSGYVRPLFLYAIECMDRDENQWAVEKLGQIKDPICRSDFFAAFGKALSDAQLKKDRRVTSKYFCIWYFGVPPPFI